MRSGSQASICCGNPNLSGITPTIVVISALARTMRPTMAGIALEPVLPGAIAEQHHRRRRGMVLLGPEQAAEHRLHPQDLEHPSAGVGAQVADGLALGAADVDGLGVVGGDVLEALLLVAPVLEVVDAHAHELDALRGPVAEKGHEPVRSVVRQPADHRRVDDAEHRRRQADSERQRDHRGGAEARPANEHPHTVSNVTEQGTHGESSGMEGGPTPVSDECRHPKVYARARGASPDAGVCPQPRPGAER